MALTRKSILCFAILLVSCATAPPSLVDRKNNADQLASARGWQSHQIKTREFPLTVYAPLHYSSSEELSIYIEGDGLAWISSEQPSSDPTPITPTGLQLALAQPSGNAVYLARPCQYGGATQEPCAKKYWTNYRFAPEVVSASNQAIDDLKQKFGAKRLTLIGYSGGGAVAALLASQRGDVERLITVAGNLDHRAWTGQHHISALSGSLNPADFGARLETIPQWHFVGGDDRNIPVDVVKSYSKNFSNKTKLSIQVVPGYDHRCCWAEQWPSLWAEIQ